MVDFGFAQRWDLSNTDGRGPTEVSGLAVSSNRAGSRQVPFWSEISWGTPEYLDPPVSLRCRSDLAWLRLRRDFTLSAPLVNGMTSACQMFGLSVYVRIRTRTT